MTLNAKIHDKIREITKVSRTRDEAKSNVERAISELVKLAEPLPAIRFWAHVTALKKELDSTIPKNYEKSKYSSGWNVRQAVDSFRVDNFSDKLYEMVRFVKTYNDMVSALHRNEKLSGNITGVGDDGYGDILDSFPLFGKKRYHNAIKNGNPYKTMKELEERDGYAIFQGENYICSSLYRELVKVSNMLGDDESLPPTKVFVVKVVRTGIATREIEIDDVDTAEEAEAKALDIAGDFDYNEFDAEYSVEHSRVEGE